MSTTVSSDETVIAEVLAAEEARLAAIHASDWNALERFLGEDLTYTHMSGKIDTKAENIEGLKNGPRTYKRSDLRVRPYGNFAVMNGILDVTMLPLPDGTPGNLLHGRVVQVWVRRDDRWQMIVFQATAVPLDA